MRIIKLDKVDSTNSYLERESAKISDTVMVVARCQTDGRGQRGNGWESSPGENLTFSVLFHPESFRAADQFSISEATALAVVDLLACHGIGSSVKWPNDIYVGDRKICGILIHNTLMGIEISHSILGVGINVNQTNFVSDAPNPVSMKQISGKTFDLEQITTEIAGMLEKRLEMAGSESGREILHREYMTCLWRGDGGFYPFRDTSAGLRFMAAIDSIAMDGLITLRLHDGTERGYRFKEVSFLLE